MFISDKKLRWEKLSSRVLLDEFGKKIVKTTYRMPSTEEKDWNLREEKDACCILALTKENNIVLARQYRPGPELLLNELPGGYVESADRNAQSSALRELLEETGYTGNIQFVTTCIDDAYSTLKRHCYVARNCHKIREPAHDADEFIRVIEVSLQEFRKQLRSGQMTDVEVGYICLDYLDLL